MKEKELEDKIRLNQSIQGKPALQWLLDTVIRDGNTDALDLQKNVVDFTISVAEKLIKYDKRVGTLNALEFMENVKGLGFEQVDQGHYFIVFGMKADATINGKPIADWAIANARMASDDVVQIVIDENWLVGGVPALQWAAEKNHKINGKSALEYAVTKEAMVGEEEVLTWALKQDLKVDGKPVIQWAVEKGHIEKRDAIEIVVKADSKINGRPAIAWLMEDQGFILETQKDKLMQSIIRQGLTVGGKPALEWVSAQQPTQAKNASIGKLRPSSTVATHGNKQQIPVR